MKRYAKATEYLFEKMPMPAATKLWADAGRLRETKYAIAAKRNLVLDVTERLEDGMPPYPKIGDDSEATFYYARFNSKLVEEVRSIIEAVCPNLAEYSHLSSERNENVTIFFGESGSLTIRADFREWKNGVTFWDVDFFVIVLK